MAKVITAVVTPKLGCLIRDCPRLAAKRGLCWSHYDRHRARVRAGQDTDPAAEARGELAPRARDRMRDEIDAFWLTRKLG